LPGRSLVKSTPTQFTLLELVILTGVLLKKGVLDKPEPLKQFGGFSRVLRTLAMTRGCRPVASFLLE
ncbi:MAG: hypothetical protein M3Q37_11900, partial [Gemmatimonadota bacterium]|nr:hypothetical protein [Gemmatimonadota bacterium]